MKSLPKGADGMDQALVAVGLGYEVAVAATAQCREAWAGQH